jgi:hypothetical protein
MSRYRWVSPQFLVDVMDKTDSRLLDEVIAKADSCDLEGVVTVLMKRIDALSEVVRYLVLKDDPPEDVIDCIKAAVEG